MRKFIFPKLTIFFVFILSLQLATCGGGGGGGGDGGGSTSGGSSLQSLLTDFNTYSGNTASGVTTIYGQANGIKSALDKGDTSSADSLLDEQAGSISELLKQVESLDSVEAQIQGLIGSGARQNGNAREKELVLALAGVAILVIGLHGFATKMSEFNDKANEARKKRDQASADINDNVDGATERYNSAVNEMQSVGEDVIVEMTTKIVADQIASLIPAESVAELILTDQAGNKIQDKLKVLSATRECKDGYSVTKCKIGVDETDSDGKVTVPAGDIIVIVTGDGSARIVVDPVTTTGGGTTTVAREAIPIANAIANDIAANDAGTYTPGGNGGSGDNGAISYPARYQGDGTFSSAFSSTRPSQTQGTLTCDQRIGWLFTLNQNGTVDAVANYYGGGMQLFCNGASYCIEKTDTIEQTIGYKGTHSNGQFTISINTDFPLSGTYDANGMSAMGTYDFSLQTDCLGTADDGTDSYSNNHSFNIVGVELFGL